MGIRRRTVLAGLAAGGVSWPGAGHAFASSSEIAWSGRRWRRRTWEGAPTASGLWDEDNVAVDKQGHLHLHVRRQPDGSLTCAEIESIDRGFGFGTFRFSVNTPATHMAPHVVLGLFTYDRDGGPAHREIDIEASGWGRSPVAWDHTHHVSEAGRKVAIGLSRTPAPTEPTIHELTWAPGRLRWRSTESRGGLLRESETTTGVPTPGAEQVLVNLWVCDAPGWRDTPTTEVVVSNFSFEPASDQPSTQTTNTVVRRPRRLRDSPSA